MEYGLIGSKLGHSYSKIIHEMLCGYHYDLCPLPTEEEARAFLTRRQFKAINVTIPYKRLVMEYCTYIDPRAKAIGAVNTVVNKNGLLYGYNTDYLGFAHLCDVHGVDFAGRTVLILGTGGTHNTTSAVARDKGAAEQDAFLQQAAYDLAHARPTTANRYGQITYRCAEVAKEALAAGKDPIQAIVENTVESLNRRYSTMQIVGDHLAELIPQGGTILTQCFGETIIGTVIRAARCQNKDFKVFCAETRPYLQGARLTSGCFAQMGFDTTVITDNMVAYAMEREGIDLFTSAADTIARDGHIANKIGTFQIAILAKYFGIPYYVTGIPDQDKHSKDDIVIEMRDPQQVLSYRGIPNTVPEVKAIYPSFDVVPPHLISGVVTDKGVYVPYLLDHYFDSDVKKFY